MLTLYTPSVGSADEYRPELVQYEAYRQEQGTLFPTSEYVLQSLEISQNDRRQKAELAQTLTEFISTQMRRARNSLFQCLPYNCFALRYRTKSEEWLASKKDQIEVVRRKLLKTNGENGVSVFP